MNKEEVLELGEAATVRDPRNAPFGFFAGGSSGMDGVRVFSWFTSVDELIAFLLDIEPRIYDVDEPDDLAVHKSKVSPILEKLKLTGFNDELRNEMNVATNDFSVIDWWGNFSEITDGETEFSQNLIEHFVDPVEGQNMVVPADKMDEFVEYLITCGC